MQQIISELKTKNYGYFIASKYAPASLQEPIGAVLLLKAEVEDAPKLVSEPMLAEIKLQWWRDVITEIIAGKPARPHPVFKALAGTKLDYNKLLKMVDEPDAAYGLRADILGQKYNGLSDKSVFNLLKKRPKHLLFRLLVGNYKLL
jgi:phytoene/squalene synthetase